MYAVISTGGKQYRVEEGDVLRVEKLSLEEGATVNFEQVLMVGAGEDVSIGTPYVKDGKVSAEVRAHGRGDKIEVVKFIRRKYHRKQMGHRQAYTELLIKEISK